MGENKESSEVKFDHARMDIYPSLCYDSVRLCNKLLCCFEL